MTTTQTISLAMTWEQVAPMLALILTDGNATGQANAREELARMARVADMAKGWAAELAATREGLAIAGRIARLAVAADVNKRDALGELAELAELAERLTADPVAAVAACNRSGVADTMGAPEAPTAAPEAPAGGKGQSLADMALTLAQLAESALRNPVADPRAARLSMAVDSDDVAETLARAAQLAREIAARAGAVTS